MQAPPPAPIQPTAQGTFAKTPFPHLLVYALERGLSGTFELSLPRLPPEGSPEPLVPDPLLDPLDSLALPSHDSLATILVIQGAPAKVRTTEEVHVLGDVMVELGFVSAEAVKLSQERTAETPDLQGQILLELGAVDQASLDAGVRAQLARKLEHLFLLPAETVFAYYDGVDHLRDVGGAPTRIDPLPVLWRGIRHVPAWEHVDAALRRVGSAAVRLLPNAQLGRFEFTRIETSAVELLRQRPLRVLDLASVKVVGPTIAQLLIYLLLITKQVDLVEAPPAQGPDEGAPPSSIGRIPPTHATGQAFARVQLQAKPIQRAPLVIEEAPVARNASDGRLASPVPQAIPLPEDGSPLAPGNDPIPSPTDASPAPVNLPVTEASAEVGAFNLDIGELILTTIQSSMPPAMLTPEQPAVGPDMSLTAEEVALKERILERAAQISSQDYFQMLGLERDATNETVHKAFISLAKVWHPDRLPSVLVEVKDACSKVFTHLTEAQATLCDPSRRQQYMTLLKDGGATPDDQAKIQDILEAAMEFQKAEIVLKRNDTAQAYELAKKAYGLDPEQADYLAMVTWLEAQFPEWLGREKTLEKVAVLDGCIKLNIHSERAYFWRGMLYKRIDETNKALKDFKKAGELNPRNLDALREVRLHNIRSGPSSSSSRTPSKPPPPGVNRPSSAPPKPETLGGLFGKLFKK